MAQPLLPLPEVTELNGIKALPTRAAIAGQQLGPTIRSAVSGARRLGAVGAAAGTAASLGDYKLDDPEVDSSAMGTIRAVGDGNFDMARRSLGKGALEAGMDLGSAAAQTLDMVVPGTNTVSRAYGNMLRNQFGPQLIDNSGTMGSGGAGRGFVNPPMPSAVPENAPPTATPTSVSRPAFSDARMTAQTPALMNGVGSSGPYAKAPPTGNAPGTFRYADGSTGKGTVSAMETIGVDGYNRQLANIRGLGGPIDSTVGQGAGGIGGGTFGFRPASAEAPSLDTRGMSQRQVAGLRMQQAELGERARVADINAGAQRYSADVGAATSRYGTDVGASTTIRGQNIGADTARQGQALTFEANKAANRLGTFNALREQANADRTHNAGRADAAFTQGQQAIKDLHQQVAGWIPPTMQDGKAVPDTQTAARYATAMQSVVGRMGRTMKDMDESDKARIVAGMQLADVANATATGSMTPWGTRAIQSNEPILALRKLDNGDYQTNRKGVNGETEVIPGRYIEKEGSFMGMGGRPTNRFANLIEQGDKK